MTTTFPPKPWEEGATFTNDTTGVGYTYSGGKWLASGGPKVEGEYLPLAGGKLSEPGNLNVEGHLKVSTGSEFKVEFDDGTNFLRVRPDNGTTTVKGKMSVNDLFDVKDDVVEYQKNRTSISQMGAKEIINAGILDNLMRAPNDGYLKDYLPLTGGELTGQLTIKKNTQVALEIVGDNNTSQIKFWSSGAVALQNYTAFKDNELVTKKYTDDAIKTAVENIDIPDVDFTPGQQVAKLNGTYGVEVGGFYILNGNVYCRVS